MRTRFLYLKTDIRHELGTKPNQQCTMYSRGLLPGSSISRNPSRVPNRETRNGGDGHIRTLEVGLHVVGSGRKFRKHSLVCRRRVLNAYRARETI